MALVYENELALLFHIGFDLKKVLKSKLWVKLGVI